MNLYIKQKVFSWNDKFYIFDENGNERFYVEGEVFSFGKKLRIYDLAGIELAYIEQKVWSFLPKFNIYRNGEHLCTVVKNFTFFRNEYLIDELGWRVDGDFMDHDYFISEGGREIVSVCKEWFTWGDTYAVSIDDNADLVAALATVIVIDACLEAQSN
jgi:uncharacterized protein YxjI